MSPRKTPWLPEAVMPALPLEMPYPSHPPKILLQHLSLLLSRTLSCSDLKCWESLDEMSTCQRVSFSGKQQEASAEDS